MFHVKPVLYFLMIVLGLAQIGLGLATSRVVDAAINTRQARPLNTQGPQEQMHTPEITPEAARRLAMIGAATAGTGGCCMMIGTVLIATHLLQKHSARSRLGTDVKPDR